MEAILTNEYFLLALTFGVFFAAKALQRRVGWVLLNPILIAIAVIIGFLLFFDIPYDTYHESAELIEFWLKPAVVALGVPLYLQLSSIRKQLVPILMSQMIGCVVGIVSVVAIAKLFGASHVVVVSLASKSVTTPIAMEVTQALEGIPSLTAAIVVITGLIGAVAGFKMLAVGHVRNPMALGLSMGAASHALGTSAAMDRDGFVGAYASLGLTLNGILTALFTPTVIEMMYCLGL
ncbi:MAG: LrgB family protein [Prevotella sp.]